ncbi:MAG: UDP-N-acetylmuramate dehydrogenase, partial [Clostridia bacterium]|nr:UDP-N-acetylmuramate dehydrogenase [Clostridia bacterium]
TSFKIGGNADLMLFPDTQEKLIKTSEYSKSIGCPFYIIGKGSNLLFPDDGYRGVVINTCNLTAIELVDDNTIRCECGVSMTRLAKFALENSLMGLEFAYGIPGTVGGGVYMNAGAYGGEIKDVIVSATHIDSDGQLVTLDKEKLCLTYRHSFYSDKDFIITSAEFRLEKGDAEEIKAKMDDLMFRRKDKQPLEYPSAGSTFKRPEGYFAAALLDEAGLKGYSVGGAQVSEKHAGFVINKGGATASDVINLMEHCKKTVFEKFGVELEPEVKIISKQEGR